MPYTVIWSAGPQTALAQIWLQAADRRAVTNAANEIDRRLRLAPTSVGVARGNLRELRVTPLEVLYSVSPPDCQVTVSFVSYHP